MPRSIADGPEYGIWTTVHIRILESLEHQSYFILSRKDALAALLIVCTCPRYLAYVCIMCATVRVNLVFVFSLSDSTGGFQEMEKSNISGSEGEGSHGKCQTAPPLQTSLQSHEDMEQTPLPIPEI